jgi:hypothetical protein
MDATAAGSTTAAAGAPTDISLAALLALQSDEGDEMRDRPARQRGHALLNALRRCNAPCWPMGGWSGAAPGLGRARHFRAGRGRAASARRHGRDQLRVQVELARYDLA